MPTGSLNLSQRYSDIWKTKGWKAIALKIHSEYCIKPLLRHYLEKVDYISMQDLFIIPSEILMNSFLQNMRLWFPWKPSKRLWTEDLLINTSVKQSWKIILIFHWRIIFTVGIVGQKYHDIDHKEGIKNILTTVVPIRRISIDGRLREIQFIHNLINYSAPWISTKIHGTCSKRPLDVFGKKDMNSKN